MNYHDKQTVYSGGSTIKADAPLGTIPVYVREGAIIPRGDIVKLNNNWEQELDSEAAPAILPLGQQQEPV